MRLTARMDVTANGGGGIATLRVVGPDGVTGEGTFDVPCGTEERFVSITTSPLPNVVKAYTPAALDWSVQPPGATEFSPIGATSHRIYVAFGTPSGSEPTNRRLNFVCYKAAQAGDASTATDEIHAALDDDPPEDGNDGTIPAWDLMWKLMGGLPYTGECHQQAHLMNLMIQLLGVGAGAEYKTYASTDTIVYLEETTTASALGYTYDLDGNWVVGDEEFRLIFDFRPPPGQLHNWNGFEGSINVAARYYAVWNSYEADSPCELYLEIVNGEGASQHWGLFDWFGHLVYVHPSTIEGPTVCP